MSICHAQQCKKNVLKMVERFLSGISRLRAKIPEIMHEKKNSFYTLHLHQSSFEIKPSKLIQFLDILSCSRDIRLFAAVVVEKFCNNICWFFCELCFITISTQRYSHQ
jgi:hypothetical protein